MVFPGLSIIFNLSAFAALREICGRTAVLGVSWDGNRDVGNFITLWVRGRRRSEEKGKRREKIGKRSRLRKASAYAERLRRDKMAWPS